MKTIYKSNLVRVFCLALVATILNTVLVNAQPSPDADKSNINIQQLDLINVNSIATAITEYVNADMKTKGGQFLVFDKTTNNTLQLNLESVSKDDLSKISGNMYFACTEFTDSNNVVYDLDFLVMSLDNNLIVSEISIHKVNGETRYTWKQVNGLWEKDISEKKELNEERN